VSATGGTDDAALEAHVNGFLTALGQRPEDLISKHLTELAQPRPGDLEDLRRYIGDLKMVFGRGLLDMYTGIDSHGRAICEMTDEAELTGRVRQIMALVAQDAEDVPKIIASFDEAANQLNPLAIVQLFTTIQGASASGLPRQVQRDQLILDFTTYCLTRFPPTDDASR
jgi:hypothetical protein